MHSHPSLCLHSPTTEFALAAAKSTTMLENYNSPDALHCMQHIACSCCLLLVLQQGSQKEGFTFFPHYTSEMEQGATAVVERVLMCAFKGLIDSSGIRLFFTPNLRKYDMGVLQTGVFTFPVHFIPPGSPAYHSYGLCNSSQFEEVSLGKVLCCCLCSGFTPWSGHT